MHSVLKILRFDYIFFSAYFEICCFLLVSSIYVHFLTYILLRFKYHGSLPVLFSWSKNHLLLYGFSFPNCSFFRYYVLFVFFSHFCCALTRCFFLPNLMSDVLMKNLVFGSRAISFWSLFFI